MKISTKADSWLVGDGNNALKIKIIKTLTWFRCMFSSAHRARKLWSRPLFCPMPSGRGTETSKFLALAINRYPLRVKSLKQKGANTHFKHTHSSKTQVWMFNNLPVRWRSWKIKTYYPTVSLRAKLFFSTVVIFALSSCGDKNEADTDQPTDPTVTESFSERLTEVDTAILHPSTFYREVISQGKVASTRKIDVPFTAQGLITEVPVKAGQQVSKGDLLVAIDDFMVRNDIKKLETQLKQTQLNIENHYINLGYQPDNLEGIPEAVKRNAAIEFNLESLRIEEERLNHELASRRITAPFSGVITDLEVNEGAHTSAYKKVCTLIDNRSLTIHFPVLESEMERVQKGQSIQIEPIFQSSEELSGTGRITTVSPTVSEQGMIDCVAQIGPSNIPYRDGMRVNVYIRDAVPNVLVLPKSAVVDRQNRLVVFTLSSEDRAYWNYVELGGENSDSYLIRDGVQAGDTIIMNHNFDLAHLERIRVK